MINSKKIVLLITCFFAAVFSFAQQIKNESNIDRYRAVHWGKDEGLSGGIIKCMLKDVNGFLWIGTQNGLNRFDGKNFKKYFANISKKNKAITGNDITGLVEDSLHNIWIGTDKGLSVYDTKADSFRNISSGIPLHEMGPFWATRDEVYCFYSDNENAVIGAYNIHSFTKKTLYKFLPGEGDSVANRFSGQKTFFDARSNTIWMMKGYPGWAGGGLTKVITHYRKMERFSLDLLQKNSSAFSFFRRDAL